MPAVIIQSLSTVTVDGVNFGAVADVIVNNPGLASDVHAALGVYLSAELQGLRDEHASVNSAHATAISDLESQLATALGALEAARAELTLNEAMQVDLVTQANTAFQAGNLETLGQIIEAAKVAPTLQRARQAATFRLAAAQAELQSLA